ncbi:MAG: hypothetical protein WDM85_02310 [Caulobacteraceae bacterium]
MRTDSGEEFIIDRLPQDPPHHRRLALLRPRCEVRQRDRRNARPPGARSGVPARPGVPVGSVFELRHPPDRGDGCGGADSLRTLLAEAVGGQALMTPAVAVEARRALPTLALCFVAVLCEGLDIQSMGLAALRMGPALHLARDQLGPAVQRQHRRPADRGGRVRPPRRPLGPQTHADRPASSSLAFSRWRPRWFQGSKRYWPCA